MLSAILLVLCGTAACVSATYNRTCARELVWGPTSGKTSETLELGWPDGVPAILVLVNATSNHYVRITGRYNKDNGAPDPVAQEAYECIPLGTNTTLLVPNIDAAARIRLDPVTNNTLVEPLPGRGVVFAYGNISIPVLERLANMTRVLAHVEDQVFGPGAAPNVTSVPPPAVSAGHPGTWGTDHLGRLVIEALPGKKVLVAGVDVILELHRITERTKNLRAAMAACPCLAKPATCRPCGAGGCAGTPRCTCIAGWRGTVCDENLNECAQGTHNCNATSATCVDTNGSFNCICNTGFAGSGVSCVDVNVNKCAVDNGGCAQTCTNRVGGYDCSPIGDCKPGFAANGATCLNVNECASNTHNCHAIATCADTAGSFTCACMTGFTGDGVTTCTSNECALGSHNCNANAACTSTPGSFTCVCRAGYSGNGVACSNVNECMSNAHNCHANFACTDTAGSFTCACRVGYVYADNGTSCGDVNECLTGTHSCSRSSGNCANTAGSFVCFCNAGSTGSGVVCSDVDECLSGNGGCAQTCTNSAGSFTCSCAAGFAAVGAACNDLNECQLGTHSCNGASASCANTAGSFTCACNLGFTGNGIVCVPSRNVTGTLQWARQAGSTRGDEGRGVAVDEAGRVFLVGNVAGAADGLGYSGGNFDAFLVAYNTSAGTKLWSRMLASGRSDISKAVAADGAGSLYVAGYTNSSSFGSQTNAGGQDVFLARYDSNSGTRIWTMLLGTASDDHGQSVAVDRGNPDAVYVGGYTERATGSGLPGSAGGLGGSADAFVARFSSAGTRVWVRQFGSRGGDMCYGVAVYQTEIYATGYTTGVMAGTSNAGVEDIFITRITVLGVVAWTVQLGSIRDNHGFGIVVDSTGVYVTGDTSGSLNGQPDAGKDDVFVARYTHAGDRVWTRMLGTSAWDGGKSVALDQRGNVLITGYTQGALSGQTNAGNNAVFVASFTSGGVLQWTRLYGTRSSDTGHSIAVDRSSGAAFVAGITGGSMYGQPNLGGADLFVLKLQ